MQLSWSTLKLCLLFGWNMLLQSHPYIVSNILIEKVKSVWTEIQLNVWIQITGYSVCNWTLKVVKLLSLYGTKSNVNQVNPVSVPLSGTKGLGMRKTAQTTENRVHVKKQKMAAIPFQWWMWKGSLSACTLTIT